MERKNQPIYPLRHCANNSFIQAIGTRDKIQSKELLAQVDNLDTEIQHIEDESSKGQENTLGPLATSTGSFGNTAIDQQGKLCTMEYSTDDMLSPSYYQSSFLRWTPSQPHGRRLSTHTHNSKMHPLNPCLIWVLRLNNQPRRSSQPRGNNAGRSTNSIGKGLT